MTTREVAESSSPLTHPRCGNRHQKLGAYYFDEGFFT